MNKTWQIQPNAPDSFFEEFPELPKTVANLLYHRNIKTQAEIDEFLNPDYSQDIHDPFIFSDMEKAVTRIFAAIEKQEKIIVHGDYDADGVSAATILVSTIKMLGAKHIDTFIPHRETDGYGLNKKNVQAFKDDGINLIISCDCGISNVEEIEFANELNLDIIITDHHAVPETPPPAYAIIHPQVDYKYPCKTLAGGAVAFKLAQGLLKTHKKDNELLPNGQTHEAWEKWLLDLVAIASVADMVPLIGETRTLTKYGLIVLNKTKRIGLQKLLLEAKLIEEDGTKKRELDTYTIGFMIAPRVNAAGRMNHANVAYNLFMTDDNDEAANLARELNNNNIDRQGLTEKLVKEAVEQIEKDQLDSPVLFVLGEGWSTGVVGLIAGRIKEKYYKPTLALAKNNNEITGSGRSIEGFNLIESMQEMPEVFSKFGGHPMACGFTLKNPEMLEEFKTKLTEKFVEKTKDLDLTPTLAIDAEIDLDDVNWELHDILDKFKPFGQANEKPKYLSKNIEVISADPIGKDKKHMKMMIKSPSGKIKKVMGWNLCNENNGDDDNWCKNLTKGDKIDMVFEISLNEWNGNREIQLTIVDIKMSCDTDDADLYSDVADNADIQIEKENNNNNLFYKDLTYKINGILFKVHNELGRHQNEKQICDAIEKYLKEENINYEREKILPPSFEGEKKGRNRIDFLIEDKFILEIKTVNFIGKQEYHQCLRYLEALNKKLCILVNFRTKHLKTKRILNPKAKI